MFTCPGFFGRQSQVAPRNRLFPMRQGDFRGAKNDRHTPCLTHPLYSIIPCPRCLNSDNTHKMSTMFTTAQVKAIAADVEAIFAADGAPEATVELILTAAASKFAALVGSAPAMTVASAPVKVVQAYPHFQSLITDKLTAEVRSAVEAAIGTIDFQSVRDYSDKTKVTIAEMNSADVAELFVVQPNLTAAIAAAKKKFNGFALAGFLWKNLTAEQHAAVKTDGGVVSAAVPVAAVGMVQAAPKSSSGAKKQGHNIIKSAISAAAVAKDNDELKALIDMFKTHLGKTSAMDLGNGLWKRMTKAQQTEWHDVSATMPADKASRDLSSTFNLIQVHLQASAENDWAIIEVK